MALAVPIGLAALQGASSYSQARSQNRAVSRAQGVAIDNARREQTSLAASTAATRTQLEDQAAARREQRLNQLAQTRGTISTATAGVFSERTRNMLDRSAVTGGRTDVGTIQTDLRNSILRLNSGFDAGVQGIQSSTNATLANLNGQRSSSGLAGISGGLSGFTSGLNIRRLLP